MRSESTGSPESTGSSESAGRLPSDGSQAQDGVDADRIAATTRVPEKAVLNLGRLAPVPLGIAVGTVAALALCLATWILHLRGGEVVGPHLGLLAHYFPGYAVSVPGALVGSLYAGAVGFAVGAAFAGLRNAAIHLYLSYLLRRVERQAVEDLLDWLS